MFQNENERQRTKQVPIPLTRASRKSPDVKTRNEKKIYNSTLEIIPFIRFGKQMDRKIDGIISEDQLQFILVSCFDIREVPRSPGK